MPFTLEALATELGIPAETLQGKAEIVTKWNGYLSEADTKYREATQAQKDAEAKLAQLAEENRAIDENIKKYGATNEELIALRANEAAMKAQLQVLKEQGLDVTIPAPVAAPAAAAPAAFDPNAFRSEVNNTLVAGFNVNNRYQRLYGKPMPDDVDVLAREAAAARKPFTQYVAEKYDFGGEEKRQAEAATKKHDAEIADRAVKEYREKNPITAGNPEFAAGRPSRMPQLPARRDSSDLKTFANQGFKQKIAQSVARTREALASSAA